MTEIFKCGYIQVDMDPTFIPQMRYCEMQDQVGIKKWIEVETGGAGLGAAIVKVDAPQNIIDKLNTLFTTDVKDIMTNQSTKDLHYTDRRLPVVNEITGVITCTGDLVKPPKTLEEMDKKVGISDNFNIR